MIDLHTHILNGLDDGPKSLEESIEMCRMAYRDGIRIVVATPHTLNGVYRNDRSTVLARVQELNQALIDCGIRNAEFGMENPPSPVGDSDSVHCHLPATFENSEPRTPNSELNKCAVRNPQFAIEDTRPEQSFIVHRPSSIGFQVLPGSDVSFSSDLVKRIEMGEVGTLNEKGRSILLEFPSQGIPYRAEDILFQFMAKGIVPVISHPERNLEIARKPERYYEMIRRGCLGQVTAMSLTGGFGSGIRRVAEKLLASRLLHIIGSDAHSIDGRPPILSRAVRAAEKILGAEEARKMVTEYPQAVLEGRRPKVPDPMLPNL